MSRAILGDVVLPLVRRRGFGVLLALLASACLSPTLPLPPPSRPTVVGPDAAGNVRLTGRVPAGSQVSALNTRTNLIAGQKTRQEGRYDFQIGAAPGDEILFWYSRSNMNSPAVVVTISEPSSLGNSGGAAGASSVE